MCKPNTVTCPITPTVTNPITEMEVAHAPLLGRSRSSDLVYGQEGSPGPTAPVPHKIQLRTIYL